jgi:hypothetical protein
VVTIILDFALRAMASPRVVPVQYPYFDRQQHSCGHELHLKTHSVGAANADNELQEQLLPDFE